jgi:hypothetical protein
VIVAVGVNADGRREVLGMDIGPSEAETFWTELLRKLAAAAVCPASSSSSPTRMKGEPGDPLQNIDGDLTALPRSLHA